MGDFVCERGSFLFTSVFFSASNFFRLSKPLVNKAIHFFPSQRSLLNKRRWMSNVHAHFSAKHFVFIRWWQHRQEILLITYKKRVEKYSHGWLARQLSPCAWNIGNAVAADFLPQIFRLSVKLCLAKIFQKKNNNVIGCIRSIFDQDKN